MNSETNLLLKQLVTKTASYTTNLLLKQLVTQLERIANALENRE